MFFVELKQVSTGKQTFDTWLPTLFDWQILWMSGKSQWVITGLYSINSFISNRLHEAKCIWSCSTFSSRQDWQGVNGCSPGPSQGKTEKYKPCMHTLMPKDNSDLPWKNPYMHRKSMQTPCRKAPGLDLNPEAFSCRQKQKYISANTKHAKKKKVPQRWGEENDWAVLYALNWCIKKYLTGGLHTLEQGCPATDLENY